MNTQGALNSIADTDVAVFRGAAVPLVVRNKVDGVYTAFATTLHFRAKVRGAQVFELTVGAGIVLSAFNAVANAQATVTLTESQSLQIPVGAFATYELAEGVSPNRSIVMAGSLTGEEAR